MSECAHRNAFGHEHGLWCQECGKQLSGSMLREPVLCGPFEPSEPEGHPMSDLEQRIKEAAEKATQGEWQMYGGNYSFAVHPKGVRDVVIACDVHLSEPQWKGRDAEIFPKTGVIKMEDAIYIALVSPSNIKALLAEKDAEIADLKTQLEQEASADIQINEQIGNMDAEIERLTRCLKRANDGLEEYERKFYLESDKVESLKARAEQWEQMAAAYRSNHAHDTEVPCVIYESEVLSSFDDRCDICKAYDALSGPREGEQDAGECRAKGSR